MNNIVIEERINQAEESLDGWKTQKSKLEEELEKIEREIFIHEGYLSAYRQILNDLNSENKEENIDDNNNEEAS